MEERGVEVDHSTPSRWVLKYAPLLEQEFRARKRQVDCSWRMDETYVKVKGIWKYLVSSRRQGRCHCGFPADCQADRKVALRFLRKAFRQHGTPEKITIDKNGANKAAIESYNAEHKAGIEIRQVKYLNNIVEQDHQAVRRLVRPMLGFKSFRSAVDPCRYRTHAHDPQGSAADDKRNASGAAILLAGVVSYPRRPGRTRTPRKFATEPISSRTSSRVCPPI